MHGRAAERVPVSWVADCAVGARESFARITTPLARGLAVPLALVTVAGEERRLIGEAFGLSREIGAPGRSAGGSRRSRSTASTAARSSWWTTPPSIPGSVPPLSS